MLLEIIFSAPIFQTAFRRPQRGDFSHAEKFALNRQRYFYGKSYAKLNTWRHYVS